MMLLFILIFIMIVVSAAAFNADSKGGYNSFSMLSPTVYGSVEKKEFVSPLHKVWTINNERIEELELNRDELKSVARIRESLLVQHQINEIRVCNQKIMKSIKNTGPQAKIWVRSPRWKRIMDK